jgi:pSer/pThr/pTyr-binding forkhead associated (FHA) protein
MSSIKSWVLGLVSRADLPPREPSFEPTRPAPADAKPRNAEPTLASAEHLGAYGALIGTVRDELEHFIISQLRLHLAIADRDRFLLTSIDVHCNDAEASDLLRQFMHEFKPEQVKRYLAREVIAGLPNAAAIDLSQFGGLVDADAHDDDAGEYGELLAVLGSGSPTPEPAYRVDIVGRWTETDAKSGASVPAQQGATPSTPLAGQRCEFELEDADGRRRVVLPAVVPGRRYVIGKGEGCDICLNATYTSRRHAEIWLDRGTWWVTDAGSTNGIRVEPASGAPARSGAATVATVDAPIELIEGARMVLSARSEGPASEYPWIALRSGAHAPARITPIATASPTTPLTAIRPAAQSGAALLRVTTVQSGSVRTVELRTNALPVSVGRSRNQTLVIDRRHDGVSGHHFDIVEIEEHMAYVLVHGDNGVLLDGVRYGPGDRLCWHAGQTMVLGESALDEAACTLVLAHGGGPS